MKEREEEMEGLIGTGVFITDDELVEIKTSVMDPNASKFGPRRRKEPFEVLQEIAERKGLPKLDDMYGLTRSGQIVCRDLSENREVLKNLSENK